MNKYKVGIEWPNGTYTCAEEGSDWLLMAKEAGVAIPTGCLTGSCGACEIEVDGKILRACINSIPNKKQGNLKVEFAQDPYW